MDLNNNASLKLIEMDLQEINTLKFITEGLTCVEIGKRSKVKTSRIGDTRKIY